MSGERQKEIQNLSQLISMAEDKIKMRELELGRAKTVNNHSQCAEILTRSRNYLKKRMTTRSS